MCPQAESEASSRVVDSLINYETVQYFGNVGHEVGVVESDC